MRLVYIFPEPLPLPRARGIQVAHTVACLAECGVAVSLLHAPGIGDPFAACGLQRPPEVQTAQVRRNLFWPLSRIQSNRIFFHNLRPRLNALEEGTPVMVRHIKLAAMLVRAYPHLPLIYEAHEVFAETASTKQRERIARDELAVMMGAATVVTNSRATATRLRERYPEIVCPLEVIPNGVDIPPLSPSRDWRNPHERVIYTGSFFGWKGVADLVAAAAELPEFSIRLIGGDTEQVAKLTARTHSPQAHLYFEGRRPHGEIMSALSESCIAVLPNRPDTDSQFTSPIKLFEYMGAGCAVVASDLPSIREILDEDEAAWFTPGDPGSLAAALRRLASDPGHAQRMGETLRRKAENYTWSARARRLTELISRLSHDS